MSSLRRILVAIDFSPGSALASKQAFGLCSGSDCAVTLAHVIDVAPAPNPLYAHYAVGSVPNPEQLARMKGEALRALEGLVAADARARGIAVGLEVRCGQPVETLLELAAEISADAIVVGDSGRGPLSRALLGSVANRLVHQAPCSVLIAREKQT